MADNTVRDDIVVNAGPDAIMDVIADFATYPDWQDEIKAVEVLATDDDGWGTRARFVIDAKVFKTEVVLDYTYEEHAMRWTLVEGDSVKKDDGAYVLEDLGDGTTRVTYEVDIEPSIPIPALLRRKAARKIAEGALKGMKQRVESGA